MFQRYSTCVCSGSGPVLRRFDLPVRLPSSRPAASPPPPPGQVPGSHEADGHGPAVPRVVRGALCPPGAHLPPARGAARRRPARRLHRAARPVHGRRDRPVPGRPAAAALPRLRRPAAAGRRLGAGATLGSDRVRPVPVQRSRRCRTRVVHVGGDVPAGPGRHRLQRRPVRARRHPRGDPRQNGGRPGRQLGRPDTTHFPAGRRLNTEQFDVIIPLRCTGAVTQGDWVTVT